MASVNPQLVHLLRRTGFGPTAADIQKYSGLPLPTVVERLLNTTNAPPVVPPASINSGQAIQSLLDMRNWWYDRMATTAAPLAEKMTLFWHGHFCSSCDQVPLLWSQNQILRAMSLGQFEPMFQAIAVSPAMLKYLDGDKNVMPVPNENFAREMLELMSLGVNQYAQSDVVAAAHAWTGFNLDSNDNFTFNAAAHDSSPQTFLGITKPWTGPQVITEICTGHIASVCATFLATELWSYFAYPNPEPDVVSDLVGPFLASNLNITTLMRTILNHPRFFSAEAQGALVRTPTDFVASTLRATGLAAADVTPALWATQMGQQLFMPPNVAGWGQNAYWISDSATWGRAQFAKAVANELASQPNWRAMVAAPNAVGLTLSALGIFTPSGPTTSALYQWLATNSSALPYEQVFGLVALALMSPDYQLA